MEEIAIGEDIKNIYKVYIVALPENKDDYIKVSVVPVLCIDGTFYYRNNRAEHLNSYETMMKTLTPEWAKKYIAGYREGMKLVPVNAFCDYYYPFDADKANERLRDKLTQLTRWDFYNKKY